MAVGLCGIPRMALHPISCLALDRQVLIQENTGWTAIRTDPRRDLTPPTVTHGTTLTQVHHMLMFSVSTLWGTRCALLTVCNQRCTQCSIIFCVGLTSQLKSRLFAHIYHIKTGTWYRTAHFKPSTVVASCTFLWPPAQSKPVCH